MWKSLHPILHMCENRDLLVTDKVDNIQKTPNNWSYYSAEKHPFSNREGQTDRISWNSFFSTKRRAI